jgi:hypothetical protein
VLSPEPQGFTQPPSAFEPRAMSKVADDDTRRRVGAPRLELYVR